MRAKSARGQRTNVANGKGIHAGNQTNLLVMTKPASHMTMHLYSS